MDSTHDTASRLSTAERNSIILNESRGIHHPLYYVCTTKTGKIQVRKRRTPLVTQQPPAQALAIQAPHEATVEQQATKEAEKDYGSITNRELLECMLDVLQKNVVSNDANHNSVENERITQENQQFIDNIVSKGDSALSDAPQAQQEQEQHSAKAVIPLPARVHRRGRVLARG